ncbi:MAG: PAS domain S-box protein [Gammaproteobacteria bacterium]
MTTAFSRDGAQLPGAASRWESPSAALLTAFYEASSELFLAFHVGTGEVLHVNPALARCTGYVASDLRGRCLFDYVPAEDHDAVRDAVRVSKQGGIPVVSEVRVRAADGTQRTLRWTSIPLPGEDAIGCGVGADVTALRHARDAAQEHRARFELLAQAVPCIIAVTDAECRALSFNRAWYEFTGATVAESLGDGWTRFIHPDEVGALRAAIDRLRRQPGDTRNEFRLRRHDGVYRTMLVEATPAAGAGSGFIASIVDITDRLQSERVLRALVTATSATGQAFLDALVTEICRALGLRYAVLTLADPERGDAQTLAVSCAGELIEGFTFELRHAPCLQVLDGASVALNGDAMGRYPHFPLFHALDVRTYLGVPLLGIGRRAIGVLAVMHDGEVADPDSTLRILDIFAARAAAEIEREASERRLRRVLSELSLVEERERKRFSQVLHDTIVQDLALAKMKLAALPRIAGTDEAAALEDLRVLLDKMVHESRTLVFEISPPILYDLGLAPALEWLGERVAREAGLVCAVRLDEAAAGLPRTLQVVAFQAVRELLANVRKHARAGRVSVHGIADGADYLIDVEDDGEGFDPNAVPEGEEPRYGLFHLRDRIGFLGGDVTVDSRSGRGTRVRIRIPRGT